MKKLLNQLLLFSAVGGMLFMTSCGSDDAEVPSAALTLEIAGVDANTTTFNPGETIDLTLNFVAEAELAGLSYVTIVDGNEGNVQVISFTDVGLGNTETEGSVNITFPVDASLQGLPVTIVFTAEDKLQQTASGEISFTVTSEPNVDIYDAFLLAAPLGNGTSQTFFSTSIGERYSDDDVLSSANSISPIIDFGYYYGATNEASLAGIETYPTNVVNVDAWDVQNNTLFRTSSMTEAEFDAITEFDADDLAAEYEVGSAELGQKNNLTAGTVLAFKTDETTANGSKFGLIKVVSITGTDGENDGINIEVKVAQ